MSSDDDGKIKKGVIGVRESGTKSQSRLGGWRSLSRHPNES